MKTLRQVVPLLVVLFAGTVGSASAFTRYLHVRVDSTNTHELVRINIPLELAEKIIPAINHGQLRNGKIQIGHFNANNINLKMILDSLKSAPEGEFVTVQETDNDVRVAKEHGQLVVHVAERKKGKENVDVTIPWEVAQALASDTDDDQINLIAAIKALEHAGDVTLVAVSDHNETVRVWIDSRSTAD